MRAVLDHLVTGVGVDRGHEALLDAGEVVEDLGQRSQCVRRARGIGDDGVLGLVGLIVDTVGEGDIGTLRGGADEDLLGSRVEVGAGLVGLREAAGGFEGDVDVELAPGQLRGILLSVDLDRLAIDDDRVVGGLDGVVETAERGVELQQPGEIRDGAEVIDGHDFEFTAAFDQGPKGVASDAAETVDSNASQCHSLNTGFVLISPS